MRRECRERFPRHRPQRKPLFSDRGMHHGTCVTRVPWYMSGSLTHSDGEHVPCIPSACATRNFTYLARGPKCIRTALEVRYWISIPQLIMGYKHWLIRKCHVDELSFSQNDDISVSPSPCTKQNISNSSPVLQFPIISITVPVYYSFGPTFTNMD